MRDGFRALSTGWTLIHSVEHLAARVDRLGEWTKANHPLEPDEIATATAMVDALMSQISLHVEVQGETAITCPRCQKTSHNPHDVEHQYCGFCHRFLNDAEEEG